MMWVLLDFDDQPIRYYDYPAVGTVELKEPKYIIDWNDYDPAPF
jgi:hypothetical protein